MSTDLAACVLAIEEAAAGIGGLLEVWPCSPQHTEQRLRYIHARLEEVRRPILVDRVVADLTRPAPVPYVDKRTRHDQSSDVRAWAIEHGYPVAGRGRLPRAIHQEYEAYHASRALAEEILSTPELRSA